jgi:hypothetical protein
MKKLLTTSGLIFVLIICLMGHFSIRAQMTFTVMSFAKFREALRNGDFLDSVYVSCDPNKNEEVLFNTLDPTNPVSNITTAIKITRSVIDCDIWAIHPQSIAEKSSKLVFQSTVNLTGTIFLRNVRLFNAVFANTVNFDETTFKQQADFEGSEFQQPASFAKASFADRLPAIDVTSSSPTTIFANTIFDNDANFTNVTFGRNGQELFKEAKFRGNALFHKAFFPGDTFFLNTRFSKPDSALGIKVDFSSAVFGGEVRFEQVQADNETTSLRGASFNGKVSFRNSRFGVLDLTGITMSDFHKLDLFDVIYDTLLAHDFQFNWVTTSSRSDDKQSDADADSYSEADSTSVFANLESNFRKQGRQDLANEAFFNKRQIECAIQPQSSNVWFDCALGLFSGYLVHFQPIIVESFIVFLFFGVIFWLLGAKPKEDATAQTAPQLAPGLERFLISIRDAFSLSFITFVSLKPIKGDSNLNNLLGLIHATSIVKYAVVPILVNIEWVIGIYFLIALGATLTNTIPLLAQLLTQLPRP